MAEATIIKPDLDFINDVIRSGGESLKRCFQCATCSVVCNVTPDSKPFPRKEMIDAQWGLKERLFSNPDIWLCHQCSDCTAYCPRGAKPGEVLNAIRRLSLQHYSAPRFLARAVSNPKALWFLFAVPILIFLLITGSLGTLSNIPRGEDGGIVYSRFIPVIYVDIVFISAAAFAILSLGYGIYRYWKDMTKGMSKWSLMIKGSLLITLLSIIGEILLHKRFKKCDLAKGRQISHLFVFYSFVGLAITTTIAMWYLYGLKWESPYPLTDPIKWLGNASAIALILGLFLVIINRFKNQGKAGLGSYYDWLFILIVTAIAFTGLFSEIFRLTDIGVLAYPTYFIHLVLVFFLFAYAPFSKMAHMFYRATAMVFAKQSEREI